MSKENAAETAFEPPALRRAPDGAWEMASLADVLQWFLAYDERVAVVRLPQVEEVFQWKQETARRTDPDAYLFGTAEDRFAIGVLQALAENNDERSLHAWITEVLEALSQAAKLNEEITESYQLATKGGASAVSEAARLPTDTIRTVFLSACWLEALCTAEARVLGWFYQAAYGRPYNPQNF